MNGIVKWWASNPVAANLLMIAILIGGAVAYFTMDREIDPYVEVPGAQISVVWLGASPKDIEEQIAPSEPYKPRKQVMPGHSLSSQVAS